MILGKDTYRDQRLGVFDNGARNKSTDWLDYRNNCSLRSAVMPKKHRDVASRNRGCIVAVVRRDHEDRRKVRGLVRVARERRTFTFGNLTISHERKRRPSRRHRFIP